jgi:hypothetical protein
MNLKALRDYSKFPNFNNFKFPRPVQISAKRYK